MEWYTELKSNSTVANSETQFNQSFNKTGDFSSEGIINVEGKSELVRRMAYIWEKMVKASKKSITQWVITVPEQ